MSKRFGRNQKRRMRDELAGLREAYQRESALVSWQGAKLRQTEDTVRGMIEAIESVCRHSSILPPKIFHGGPVVPPRFRVRSRHPFPALDYFAGNSEIRSPLSGASVDLYALRLFVEKHYQDFTLSVHLQYEGKDGAAYMISERALKSMPEEELIKRFAPRIAKELVWYLRKSNG